MLTFLNQLQKKQTTRVSGIDETAYGFVLAELGAQQKTVFFAKNHAHALQIQKEIHYFAPKVRVEVFPAWDVQPYDRLGPDAALVGQRLKALVAVQSGTFDVLITTVNAVSTKCHTQVHKPINIAINEEHPREEIIQNLVSMGYARVGTVMEPGEFAVRGALLDVFPTTIDVPIRLDYFDDDVEAIHTFDVISQRTEATLKKVRIVAASDILLTENAISLFRERYREYFENATQDDLYKRVSQGISDPSLAHYMSLLVEDPLQDIMHYLPKNTCVIAPEYVYAAHKARQNAVQDAYNTRKAMMEEQTGNDTVYRPLPIDCLYMADNVWQNYQKQFHWLYLSPFKEEGTQKYSFIQNDFGKHLQSAIESAKNFIKKLNKNKVDIEISSTSISGLERVLKALELEEDTAFKTKVSPCVFGFFSQAHNKLVVTEQDIFGAKMFASTRRKRHKNEEAIMHFSELSLSDFVVHEEHGIGRFEGLITLNTTGVQQDFIKLIYAGDDRLFVPVEALDVISRYKSSEADGVTLDKLGSTAWQTRKARAKKDLMEMASELMRTAAKRRVKKGHRYNRPDGLYDEFCGLFPYQTTVEQQSAISDVEADMFGEQPMDRLIVGDVGFGKTEVALRAAFIAVMDGRQTAIIVPTTLLAKQHFDLFSKRFEDFAVNVVHLDRLVTRKEAEKVKQGLKTGRVDIVIGTHALLAESVVFKNLGLMIIDEEQRFGVRHKEKLKKLRENVDVLTLTATPIPRTLQMAIGGVKTLSLITTPPVDRLSVRTYVMKFDAKSMRDAIMREVFRGGQVYIVTPLVRDIPKLAKQLQKLVPEATFAVAHGQLPERQLENVMTDFYEGKANVLIATTIIESGIDVPKANTLIVNRADRFGLAQLHQLRGRVGRSNVRAYAYMLLPETTIAHKAMKRLRILQRFEALGSGFNLASYDMDIRGFGNLVGKEQSGQVKEVGFELYTKLLKENMAKICAQKEGEDVESHTFTPTLNVGFGYLIPEGYVPDLGARMQLYRRLANLTKEADIADFKTELLERFGVVPEEVERLLVVMLVRNQCRALNIIKLDVGEKGILIEFYQNTFHKPVELLDYVMKHAGLISVRPDQKIMFYRTLGTEKAKLKGIQHILEELAEV